MPNNVSHFAIHADDVSRARRFYERVFGWRFEAWGPPGFFNIRTGTDAEPGIQGALHARKNPVSGQGMIGYECTLAVANVDEIAAAVEANGGKVVMQKFVIPTVGTLIHFQDTEGNIAGAMQYDPNAK